MNKARMMKNLMILLFVSFLTNSSIAQALDEELGFIYVKADYLLETNRYEESIVEFSKIIAKSPSFKDVLYKRAKAKYALAAYKGVKKDLLQSFEINGILPESLLLFGEAQEAMEEEGASNTMEIASILYPDNKKASKYKKEEPAVEEQTQKSNDEKVKEEVQKIEDRIASILKDLLPSKESETNGDKNTADGSSNGEESSENEDEMKMDYIVDKSVNEIYIDEDLTLEIRNGLGNRTVVDQPNILILSESSGDVAINVCVNKKGKVVSAEFNSKDSTINTQSLISLAVRKSNEFLFEKSSHSEVCGTIIFKINGRA